MTKYRLKSFTADAWQYKAADYPDNTPAWVLDSKAIIVEPAMGTAMLDDGESLGRMLIHEGDWIVKERRSTIMLYEDSHFRNVYEVVDGTS